MEIDEKYMRRALQLAVQGAGHASPNPMVGAVIVHNGRIIGEGFHRCCGQGHAEVNAVASVSEADRCLLSESTIYVTLEPCSHYGKTPPCAKLLVDVGLRRVAVGTLDPFEQVRGRGVEMLLRAGAEVEVGVLEDECWQLNRRFFAAHVNRRPWVQLKWAQTADGFIGLPQGSAERPLHISTPVTLALMHRERAMADAIERFQIDGINPLVVVLDGITDVRNFGAIARTCECAGVNTIVIPERNSVGVTADAVKTSAGALNYLPVCRESNLVKAVKYLKDSGCQVIGAAGETKTPYTASDYTGPVAIVLGSEDNGISPEIKKLCDELVAIPEFGEINSLNVSVAGGIMIYEVVRQRIADGQLAQ